MKAKAHRGVAWPQLRFRDHAHLRRSSLPVIECYAVPQPVERFLSGCAFHLCPIGLGQFVFRVGDAGLQGTIVGQQHQSFAIVVEPAGGAYIGQHKEIGE
jgi:hypothetical protein